MTSQHNILWTNDLIMEFLELYKRERVLWDPTHSQHKNRTDIAAGWERIKNAISVDCDVAHLKKKKESMMTTFRLHVNRKRRCPSYQSCWFAYNKLESFLGPKYEMESSNLDNSTSQLENQFFTSDESYAHDTSLESPDPILIQNEEKKPCIYKKHNIKQPLPNPQKTLTLTLNANNDGETDILRAKKRVKEETDEYELYGQLLAKKLKKLDEHQRDIAMHEIDMIMFRVKMQNGKEYRKEHNYTSPTPPSRKIQSPLFIVTRQNDTHYEDENQDIEYEEITLPQ